MTLASFNEANYSDNIDFLIIVIATRSALAEIECASDDCVPDALETTPSIDFALVGDGSTVFHKKTGLVWQRCALGQSWENSTCEGRPNEYSWREALAASDEHSGWRLPNIKELDSLVEECKSHVNINRRVFPQSTTGRFWSASPDARDSERARGVRIWNGHTGAYPKNENHHVMLVRETQ